MRNENGFILPLAIILSLLFAALVMFQIDLLESDRQFFQERKNYFQHINLLHSASIEVLSILEKQDTIEVGENGQLNFAFGTVTYEVNNISGEAITIKLFSTTGLTGKRQATFTFDQETNTIIKWME